MVVEGLRNVPVKGNQNRKDRNGGKTHFVKNRFFLEAFDSPLYSGYKFCPVVRELFASPDDGN